MVVKETIAHLVAQNARLDEATRHIRALIHERDGLLSELNQWRSQDGIVVGQPSGFSTRPIQQDNHEESSQVRLSATRKPAWLCSPLESVLGDGDLRAVPAPFQVPNVPTSTPDENASIKPLDAVGSQVSIFLIDQSIQGLDLVEPFGSVGLGTLLQQPAQIGLFDYIGGLTAVCFDGTFALEAHQPALSQL